MSGLSFLRDSFDRAGLVARFDPLSRSHQSRDSLSLVAVVVLSFSSLVSAAVFDQPSTTSNTNRISGTTPSGLTWEAVATGTALPIRSTNTAANEAPGAVAYYNVVTGQLQIDPKGWDLSLFNFTYATGTVNVSPGGAGPIVVPVSSGTLPWPIDPINPPPGYFPPGVSGSISKNRIGGAVSLVSSPSTVWFNEPWSFPLGLIDSGSLAVVGANTQNWKVFGVTGNANANILGYGNYVHVFQYTINGTQGNQVGAVIPVGVPEPSTIMLAGIGGAAAGSYDYRRRQKRAKRQAA